MPGTQASGLQLALGQPRTLAYGQGVRRGMRLLEVADEGMLEELLDGGLCLKGAPGEDAVLCTASKTYAVKTVETTNLVLLLHDDAAAAAAAAAGGADASAAPLADQNPNVQPTPVGQLTGLQTQMQKNQAAALQAPVVATAIASSHLEVVPVAPRLHQLDALLKERRYGAEGVPEGMDTGEEGGPGSSGAAWAGGYTHEQLLERVQCSEAELSAALRDRAALCLDGRYCLVDSEYLGTLLELILFTAVEHGWPLSALPGARTAAALQPHGYDPRVTLHCLACFSASAAGGGGAPDSQQQQQQQDGGADAMQTDAAGGDCYSLDEALVCLHFARSLLQEQPDWELGAFEEEWGRRVPEGMLPTLGMLRGEIRLYGGGTNAAGMQLPRRLKHFPLEALPVDALARFQALFAEQPRWEAAELEPYIRDLRGPGQTAEALLLKHTRASQPRPTDPVTYSLR